MPNWCRTIVTVEGPQAEVDRFHEAHVGRDADGRATFTFEADATMPKVLREVRSGGCTIDGVSVKVWWERGGEAVRIDPRTLAFLEAQYGATNWLDWARKNWGTKWDAGEVEVHDVDEEGIRGYSFETAWSPPIEWARRASLIYPEMSVLVEYDEPGMQFAGYVKFEAGEAVQEHTNQYGGTA